VKLTTIGFGEGEEGNAMDDGQTVTVDGGTEQSRGGLSSHFFIWPVQ